jgi:hypothetical protein
VAKVPSWRSAWAPWTLLKLGLGFAAEPRFMTSDIRHRPPIDS